MSDTAVQQETVVNSIPKIDPFNNFIKTEERKPLFLDFPYVFRLGPGEVDKKSGNVYPSFEKVDLIEEIQSCRELAGFDYMKKLLMTGQASPEDFYDDGQSGGDMTVLPQTIHEAKKLADENAEIIAKAAKCAGVKEGEAISGERLEQLITAEVEKRHKAYIASLEAQKVGETK